MRLIEILGPGCRRCEQATKEVAAVVERIGIGARVVHVTDPVEIASRGLLFDVPGIAIDGVVVSRGRVPSRSQIERWLATDGTVR
jgi:small redox-active disulfide protein 2